MLQKELAALDYAAQQLDNAIAELKIQPVLDSTQDQLQASRDMLNTVRQALTGQAEDFSRVYQTIAKII